MKKFLIVLSILIFTCLSIFLLYKFLFFAEEVITDPSLQQQLAESMNLDLLINLETYSSNNINKAKILEVAMRAARKNNLMQEQTTPQYLEYVRREDIHKLLKELTGKDFNEPIIVEDFYYQYEENIDAYYVIPLGTDWKILDSITSIIKRGDVYTINCVVSYIDEDSNSVELTSTIKVKYIEKNELIKYRVLEVDTSLASIISKPTNKYNTYIYGMSENGRELTSHIFTPIEYDKTILLNFEIHGYEDNYNKDGQVLVDTAFSLIEYYKENQDLLGNTRLIIIPSSNPDGLIDGKTNDGFGRCNANGVDLNRDFDANHKVFTNERNKTLNPFSAAESRALRDLVFLEEPDVVIDFHGWLNYTIGDRKIAKVFKDKINLTHKTEFNSNCNGYFSYWASLQDANALLVEFKDTEIPIEGLIEAINELCVPSRDRLSGTLTSH